MGSYIPRIKAAEASSWVHRHIEPERRDFIYEIAPSSEVTVPPFLLILISIVLALLTIGITMAEQLCSIALREQINHAT